MQCNQQNSGVPTKMDAKNVAFEKLPSSNSFATWKLKFKSKICPGSSFPTEVLVWIN